MAALTAAQIELANSLTQDELPTKLRCAICSKLAINAFRLPCCETAICENCQSTLPSSCPVCEHSPVSGADCTVYKSLRTTIRVFLKTEERKREAARPKPTTESTPSTPVQATPTPTQTEAPIAPPPDAAVSQDGDATSHSVAPEETHAAAESNRGSATAQEQGDDAQPPQESSTEDPRQSEPVEGEDTKALTASGPGEDDAAPTEDAAENDQNQEDAGDEQSGQSGAGPMNGNFMNFGGGDMNQMQMMMAMQNGMNPAAFGSFPMMGMDMGMNPMMMQNMFMNGGFGAQGMNGMNMNMGMNGFNGGSNDWNGQQSWNIGQDNFNPNAPGMGNGDFGNFNTGFRNYGHQNQFNDYRRGNYGYRGRGRGRNFYGGYNRGGYQHQGFNNHMNGNWGDQFSGSHDGQSISANGEEAANDQGIESKTGGKEVDEFGRTIRPESGPEEQTRENGQGEGQDATEGPDHLVSHETLANTDGQPSGETHNDFAPGNGDVSSAGPRAMPQGPASSLGRQSPLVEAPLNAPTGPKAMRQGLPNTSFHRLRARGLIGGEQGPNSGASAQTVASPLEDPPKSPSNSLHSRKDLDRLPHREPGRDRDVEEKSRGRHGERSRSRSRSPSRSRSRDRRDSRRHRRHRSESVEGEGYDDEYRDRKHKSSRRKSTRDEDYSSRSKDDKYAPASRSPSPDERDHKRSSHRSHRDRDEKRRDREKDKDKERESDHDRHRKSGHRSRRDRDRGDRGDRDRERDRDRDRDRDDRDYDRERDRDRGKDRDHERRRERRERDKERRHRSGKSSTTPLTPIEPSDKTFNPPTGPRGGSFSIKGASSKPTSGTEPKGSSSNRPSDSRNDNEPSRRASQSSSAAAGQKPASSKDPHTLEREARDRERLLKEAQRIAGLAGLAGKKRGREGGDERGSGSRRKSRRSEAVNTDDEEARMRRLEAEREGRRWE